MYKSRVYVCMLGTFLLPFYTLKTSIVYGLMIQGQWYKNLVKNKQGFLVMVMCLIGHKKEKKEERKKPYQTSNLSCML